MPNDLLDNPRQNRILAGLPLGEYARLLPDLELLKVKAGDIIYSAGEALEFVHFPTSCTIALTFSTLNGAMSEVAMTGPDGVVGLPLVLGGETSTHNATVQSNGAVYRLRGEVVRWELAQGGALLRQSLAFVQALMTQMAQGVVCNRHHRVEQQLSRWLLMSLDLNPGGPVVATQENIAHMLGVRREAVTEAAGRLQAGGAIKYSRGCISVIDRRALESRTCECYSVVRQEYERLFHLTTTDHPRRHRMRPNPFTLRARAEALLEAQQSAAPAHALDSVHLLHELQVHQIELELHNEELKRAYEESDALRKQYADIYDFSPVAYFTLNAQGAIMQLNLAAAILLGIKRSQQTRHRFSAFVDAESLPEFNRFFADVLSGKRSTRCVVRLAPTSGGAPVIARIEGGVDESGQECRMVVIDLTPPCTTERVLKGCFGNAEAARGPIDAQVGQIGEKIKKLTTN